MLHRIVLLHPRDCKRWQRTNDFPHFSDLVYQTGRYA
jgi:hypothetical protein